jgi:transcriptional adapter 3
VLTRNDKEGVTMEDLDTLQLELEVLLSAAAVRIRALKGEVGALEHADDKKDKKSRVAKPVRFLLYIPKSTILMYCFRRSKKEAEN